MARKNTRLLILSAHVEETLAIARILRLRTRRKLAEAELVQRHRWQQIRRTVRDRQRRLSDLLERIKLRRDS